MNLSDLTFMNLLVCFEVSDLCETSSTQSALVRFLPWVNNEMPAQRSTARKLLPTRWTHVGLRSPALFLRLHICCWCWMVDPPMNYQTSIPSKNPSAVGARVTLVLAVFLSQMAVSGVHALEVFAAVCAAEEFLSLSFLLTFPVRCCFQRIAGFRFGWCSCVCVTR